MAPRPRRFHPRKHPQRGDKAAQAKTIDSPAVPQTVQRTAQQPAQQTNQMAVQQAEIMAATPVPFEDVVKEFLISTRGPPQVFTKLPHDIAMCILDELKDPVDKLCFALTTKALWTLMKEKVKLKSFNLPTQLPPRVTILRGVIKQWEYFTRPHWRLLERLDDDNYWKACSGCLRLHHKSQFSPNEIVNEPKNRYCQMPGLIQLCPHIYLTYKKCLKLQNELLTALPDGTTKVLANGISINQALRHECPGFKAGVKLTFSTQPFLSPDRKLMFSSTYQVKNFEAGTMKESLEKFGNLLMHPCYHHSILSHCLDAKLEAPWDPDMVDGNVENRDEATCHHCDTHYFKVRNLVHSISGKELVQFNAHRIIGNCLGSPSSSGECAIVGRGNRASIHRLATWLDKTYLANVLRVDPVDEKCKVCRDKHCKEVRFLRIENPSYKDSLPEGRWKKLY